MTADRASPDSIPERLGTFEMVRPVGRGALGEMWEASDPAASRRLLVQVLPEHLAGRPRACDLLREAAYGARVSDPHVLSAEFVGQTGRNVYVATAFVAGGTLAERLSQPRALERQEALQICAQCLEGLVAAHAAGIVHGNLQPASIRLDAERALVTDFRLASALAPVTQQPGLPPGSYDVDYISPEQARGGTFGPQADLYALGVVLFRMLAGRLPFQAETRVSMAFQQMYEPPPGLSRFVPEIPGSLSAMVERLLAKDPGERYQTAFQVQADLAAWLRGAPLPSRQHPDESKTVVKVASTSHDEPPIESLSQVRNQLSTTQATVSQLQRERDELSARLQREWTAPRRRSDSVATRAAQSALVGGILMLGVYLSWNAWSESKMIPNFKDLPENASEMASRRSGKKTGKGTEKGLAGLSSASPGTTDASQGAAINEDRFPRQLVNSLGLPLIYLRAASFYMGNHEPADQVQIDLGVESVEIEDEYPQHFVQLAQGFYLGQREITQVEFERVMGYNPSAFSRTGLYASRVAGMDTGRLPVESVTWDEAVEFCRRLGELPAEKKAGRTYRLPTEAEWEYACRGPAGNTPSRYPFGNSLTSLPEHAWLPTRPDEPPFPVAELAPNLHGLHDIAGNVGEWCQDVYKPRAYSLAFNQSPGSQDDARKAPHVVRKGPRCSERTFGGPDPSPRVGFRIACMLEAPPATPAPSSSDPTPLLPVTAVNAAGMKFVRQPVGRFRRKFSEQCRLLDDKKYEPAPDSPLEERSCHHLDASMQHPFFLGVNEVTQAQYREVMGSSESAPPTAADRDLPVDQVSWYDAVEFCRRLSALPAERAAGRSYRLPTELEWEFACRNAVPGEASIPGNEWTNQNSGGHAHPVGSLPANPWGIHDILGNAPEWVSDLAPERLTAGASANDSQRSHWAHVVRGGSYREPALPPSDRRAASALAPAAGFRVVLEYVKPSTPWTGPARIVELQPATKHSAEIHAALFSINQRLALSAGSESTVRVWDFEAGRELESFAGLRSIIRSLAVSPSGRYLATGSDDGEVNLWSFPNRKVLHTFKGHEGRVYALAFGPGGDRELFSAGEDHTVRIWDVDKKEQRDQLAGRDPQLLSLDFPPDTTQVLAGGSQGGIMAWNFQNGRELPLLQVGRLPVMSLQALDNQRVLTSGALSHCVWDVPSTMRAVATAPARKSFRVLRASSDRSLLAGGDERGNLELYALKMSSQDKSDSAATSNVESVSIGPRLAEFPQAHSGPVRSLHFSADGRRILTAGADGHVRLWSLQFLHQSTEDVSRKLQLLAVSALGHRALTYGGDRRLRLWDSTNCRQLADLANAGTEVVAIAISPDGRLAACGGSDQLVRVWDVEKARLLHTLTGHTGNVLHLAFTSDGGRLVSTATDNSLRIWDLQQPREPVVCTGHKGPVYYATFVSGDRRVASAAEDGTVRFWNVADGREVQVRTLCKEILARKRPPVAISSNGDTAYVVRNSTQGSSAVSIWNLETSREVGRLLVSSPGITGLGLSPNGRFLISTEEGDNSTVWDTRNPNRPFCELAVPRPVATALAFTSTAGYALLAGSDGTLRSWDLPVYRILQNRDN